MQPALPAVLDELPAVSGRVAVAWLATAALWAAFRPQEALPAGTVLAGLAAQVAAGGGCARWSTDGGGRRCCGIRGRHS